MRDMATVVGSTLEGNRGAKQCIGAGDRGVGIVAWVQLWYSYGTVMVQLWYSYGTVMVQVGSKR